MSEDESASLAEIARLFLRLGFTAFGGPAAHIAMMYDEVVVRRRWLDEQHFLDLLGATNLIPGPNSTEMAIHVGYERGRWRGLLVAGLSFILPAAFIVGILAWAYVRYGDTPTGDALLYGIKPVIIAVVLQALLRLGRTAVRSWLMAALAVVVFLLFLLRVDELLLLAGGGILYLVLTQARSSGSALFALLPAVVGNAPFPAGVAVAVLQAAQSISLERLFLVFLKVGGLLYGSGYVLLAFLRNDLVLQLGWLTDQQLLDAVAIGQFTPGPVFTTATFVGYVLGGLPGAVVATLGIFLPSFIFVALIHRIVPAIRRSSRAGALLDGVNVAAIGLMAGVLVQLGEAAIVDLPTLLLAVAAMLVLWRFQLNSAWLVIAGAMIGLLVGLGG
ncbi:MAG: chromate efflux transporter [Candidatus Promineifilaceae bacterium]|nr:chromate efflux transporter [Candidatus Promineifilaceae bacterium]